MTVGELIEALKETDYRLPPNWEAPRLNRLLLARMVSFYAQLVTKNAAEFGRDSPRCQHVARVLDRWQSLQERAPLTSP